MNKKNNNIHLFNSYILFLFFCFWACAKVENERQINSNNNTLVVKKDESPKNVEIQNHNIKLKDTVPLRLLPVNIRNRIIPKSHRFGNYILNRHLNGTYQFQNDTLIIKESYPNILLYIVESFGWLESKIEYYDTSKTLLYTVDLRKNIPLPSKHIQKSTFSLHSHGEFLSEIEPYIIPHNYKDIADSLLIDIEVSLKHASPYRVIDYRIIGFNENQQIIGFEDIVIVLDEKGKELFKESYGKTISGSFVDENNNFLCLDFSETKFTNSNADLGPLVIKDIRTKETLLNYKSEKNEYNGGLSFQEVKRNIVYLNLGPEAIKRTDEIFAIRGLIDFNNRKFYKMTLSKRELEKKKKENPAYFKQINLNEWNLISSF